MKHLHGPRRCHNAISTTLGSGIRHTDCGNLQTHMKLVILTSDRFGSASDCLAALHDSPKCRVVQVVWARNAYSSRFRFWRQKLRKARRIGLPGALIGIWMRAW